MWPYEKDKTKSSEIMNEDFSLFFMIKRTKIHSNTDANKINSTGKIISCTDSS